MKRVFRGDTPPSLRSEEVAVPVAPSPLVRAGGGGGKDASPLGKGGGGGQEEDSSRGVKLCTDGADDDEETDGFGFSKGAALGSGKPAFLVSPQ